MPKSRLEPKLGLFENFGKCAQTDRQTYRYAIGQTNIAHYCKLMADRWPLRMLSCINDSMSRYKCLLTKLELLFVTQCSISYWLLRFHISYDLHWLFVAVKKQNKKVHYLLLIAFFIFFKWIITFFNVWSRKLWINCHILGAFVMER